MRVIELDECFVQPHAILKIAAADEYGQRLPPNVKPSFDTEGVPYEWIPVISVTLIGDERRILRFLSREERDARLKEIVEEMRQS